MGKEDVFDFAKDPLKSWQKGPPPIARRTDPQTSHDGARDVTSSGRRSAQKRKILARLLEGPATARDLVEIAVNYRARISDLRKQGVDIVCDTSAKPAAIYRIPRHEGL